MSAAAELAELRERVDLLDSVLRALGVPLDMPDGRLTGWAAGRVSGAAVGSRDRHGLTLVQDGRETAGDGSGPRGGAR